MLANLDATVQKNIASQFGVSSYPTLKWFVDGTPSEYEGGRDEETIVSWLKMATDSMGDPGYEDDGSVVEKEGIIQGTEKNFEKIL